MSVCGYVSTKYGVVYGTDSQLTPKGLFLKPYKKYKQLSDGSVILGVGEVAAWRKLCIELEKHNCDLDEIDYKNLLPSTLDGSVECILIKPDCSVWSIDGPHGIYELTNNGYFFIGSGGESALGAMYAYVQGLETKNVTLKQAEEFLVSSLKASCVLDEFCNEPLFIGTIQAVAKTSKRPR